MVKKPFAIAIFCLGSALVPVATRAGTVGDRPSLVVLLTAEVEVDKAREARFVSELKLSLEGFEVVLATPGSPGWASLSLKEQLDAVQRVTQPLDATATIWIQSTTGNAVMLHVVALNTGRAFIRIVEVEDGPEAERQLAIATSELLGQAYMLDPPLEIPEVTDAVEQVVDTAEQRLAPRSRLQFSVITHFALTGGLYRQEGQWIRPGGGAAFEMWPIAGLVVRAGFSMVAGPFVDPPDGTVSGYALIPELGLGYLWTLRRILVGPTAAVSAVRNSVVMTLGEGDAHTYAWWSARGAIGLQARLSIAASLSLFAEPSIGVLSHPYRFERTSDGSTVLRSPLFDWSVSLGICYFL